MKLLTASKSNFTVSGLINSKSKIIKLQLVRYLEVSDLQSQAKRSRFESGY